MYILGISSFSHESSCSLIKDGRILFVIVEERLNREKHTWKYPSNAIAQCLAQENITINDIDHITFFWAPSREIVGNLSHFLKFFPQSLNLLRGSSGGGDLSFLNRVQAMNNIGKRIAKQFKLVVVPDVHFIEHHLAHAASCFFVSPYTEAAILTIDGRGESTSTMMSLGQGNKITKLLEIKVPHSLGHLYAAVTDHLGFTPFYDEWKVMGMSAYGKDSLVNAFDKVLILLPDGTYRLNLDYLGFHTHGSAQWVSPLFIKTFGPRRAKSEEYKQCHFDLAYALQKTIERAGVHLANGIYARTKSESLCMTGGVVLNCLMNKRIVEETPFKHFFFQPIANDAGTSFGSALYYYHQELNKERGYVFDSPYLGIAFDDEQIEKALKAEGLKYSRSPNIAKDTAVLIAQGKIVGWYQGRMEAGPRALGHRSIVVDPTKAAMKDKLNARVKRREMFRPFAPSVLEERVNDYFIMPKGQISPYMIMIGDVRPEKRAILPAVTHNDGTARVHTVSRKTAPEYWDLINEFGKISGVPVLLNTSFNENEPIVCTPQEAINCFMRTEFDALAIGNFLVIKNA